MVERGFFSSLVSKVFGDPAPAPPAAGPGLITQASTPYECDSCSQRFPLSILGFTKESRIVCDHCGHVHYSDRRLVAEIEESFRGSFHDFAKANGIAVPPEIDDGIIGFVRLHNRFPEAHELAQTAKGYAVGIVGESNYQPAISKCRRGEPVKLFREPSNPYDPRAIAAVCARGRTIGYIGKDSFLQRAVHEEGKGVAATILSLEAGERMTGVLLDVQTLSRREGPVAERSYRGK